jgi:hypothetical protein
MRYTSEDLRAIWDFCGCDFEQFLSLLEWLETLTDSARATQIESAHWIVKEKAAARDEEPPQ